MALSRAAGLCRLALRTRWAAVRLLSTVGADGAPSCDVSRGQLIDWEALRRQRTQRPPTQASEPRNEGKMSKPSYKQVQLNKSIQEYVSAEAVLDLTSARPALLNGVNVPTALMTIAKVVGKGEPAQWLETDARFRQLLDAAVPLMMRDEVNAHGYANLLYACGQLGIMPSSTWLAFFWSASFTALHDFVPQGLSNTLYACRQLAITPPADWLQRFWDASAVKLGEFKPQALSNTLYASAQPGNVPPADWLLRFWDASALKLGEFTPQAFSNTLYAFGQLSVVLPEDWLQRFWDASALKLGEFKPQELSNTMYACGQLGITPPADWLHCFWRASALKLSKSNPQDLSNTLLACAQLDVRPPASWVQLMSDSFERLLPLATRQDLSNTSLSLAILGLWELPLWAGLWERLCRCLPGNHAERSAVFVIQAQQLYQVYQAATMERPGLLPAPDAELLAAARQAWVDRVRVRQDSVSGTLHEQVSAHLTRLGITHANERWCERAERSIDIAIEGAEAPIAVEVDGPTHFLLDGRLNGSTLLRNRMLAAHGWRVILVDFREWNRLKTSDALREEYVRRLLAHPRA